MRIGYSEFCSCYASHTPSSLTVSMLWISIVMISTPAKSIVFAAHSLVCVWNYASHAPLSQTYLHTPLKISVNSVVSSAWKKSRSKAYSLSAESISRRYTSSWSFTHTSRLR